MPGALPKAPKKSTTFELEADVGSDYVLDEIKATKLEDVIELDAAAAQKDNADDFDDGVVIEGKDERSLKSRPIAFSLKIDLELAPIGE